MINSLPTSGISMEMGRSGKKRVVLKIGTAVLTKSTDKISRGKIEDIARQIVALRDEYEFIIVSSGAIAVARQFVQLEGSGDDLMVKQALAAIGQPHLMRIIGESFRELGLLTAQCLISYMDFETDISQENIRNTIHVLVSNNYIPIINENDTVATEEIKFGDNDKLAALTARLLKADLLVIATNTFGVYDKDPNTSSDYQTIPEITSLDSWLDHVRKHNSKSSQGTGGIRSKIEASSIAQHAGIETWLVNGREDDFLLKAMKKEVAFTRVTS